MYNFRRTFQSVLSKHLKCATCDDVTKSYSYVLHRYYGRRLKKTNTALSSLFVPIPVKPSPDDLNVGCELTGSIKKSELQKVFNQFYQHPDVKLLGAENGLDSYLQHQAYVSFRRYCLEAESLPTDLHIVVSDIMQKVANITDIFPYFLRHARQIFPHLECMDDLKKISDLTSPPTWYPSARKIKRKIIFHAGPTNSGKTYHALERFLSAKSGVYCGPLKLLATEVYKKANERGTPCDLITGEERKFALGEGNPSTHVSCTVEMTSVNTPYEVAVIDEIQLVKDPSRGWAWTRALLGLMADEIHVCGEHAATDLITGLALTCNEEVEIRKYNRLTELTVETSALTSLDNVQPGDCIVCFSKNDVYAVSRGLESRGHEAAVIYGGLPPGTKLAQAQKFNDPNSKCKLLVATDAIGMGLNLSIRRIIFYSLIKPTMNEKGEKEIDTLSVSQALQIAGRAGRFGTQFEKGFVTTYRPDDLPILKNLLSQAPEPIAKSGLHPTAEQIELYAYHLPNATLSNLMNIFESICTVDDSLYFMCNTEDFKFLADMIQQVPLPLRARYVFCCAPINRKMPFVCSVFLKFSRQYSRNEAATFQWLCRHIGTPFSVPKSIGDLVHLEAVFDVLDLYLWLSNRFPDLFPAVAEVRDLQLKLDETIQEGVTHITKLLENTQVGRTSRGRCAHLSNDCRKKLKPPKKAKKCPKKEAHLKRKLKKKHSKKPCRRQKSRRTGGDSDGLGSDDEGTKSGDKDILMGRGRLTERLVSQGLLTPRMLKQLKKEWSQLEQLENKEDSTSKRQSKRKRKPKL